MMLIVSIVTIILFCLEVLNIFPYNCHITTMYNLLLSLNSGKVSPLTQICSIFTCLKWYFCPVLDCSVCENFGFKFIQEGCFKPNYIHWKNWRGIILFLRHSKTEDKITKTDQYCVTFKSYKHGGCVIPHLSNRCPPNIIFSCSTQKRATNT